MTPLFRPLVLAGLAAFVLLTAFTAADWQHQHDEGVTLDITVGRLETFVWEKRGQAVSAWPGKPKPIAEIYERLSGADTPTAGEVLDALHEPQRMPHPPAFYLLINAWAKLAGTGTVVLRAPAIMLGLLSLLALWHLARRLCGAGAADWAVLIGGTAPWLIQITCFLRPYSLVLCASLWATVTLLRLHDEDVSSQQRLRLRAAFAVVSALGLYGVYHYVFVFAWHGLLMLVLARRAPSGEGRKALFAAVATMFAAVVLYSPWLPSQLRHLHDLTQSTYFFTSDAPWEVLLGPVSRWLGRFTLAGEYSNYEYQFFRTAFTVLFLATYPFTLLSFMRAGRKDLDPRGRAFWLTVVAVPGLIFCSDVVRGVKTLFITKYAFFMFPVFLLLSVRGMRAIPSRRARVAVSAAWIALLLSGNLSPLVLHADTPHDYDVVTVAVAAHDKPGHLVVISSLDRRYGLPLVLAMRDAGIEHVYLTRARTVQLPELIATVGARKRWRRLTLLNLKTDAELDSIVTDEALHMWTQKDINGAFKAGQVAGFTVKKRHVRGEKFQLAGEGEKRLLIIDGVHHKTFHGPN